MVEILVYRTIVFLFLVCSCGSAYSFELPSFHLAYLKDGKREVAIEDMTGPECKARAKTFKPRAKAQCIFDPGEREVS